jgi:iron(III) transport system ATP-binding protein
VADFIGDSNILDAEILTISGDTADVRLGNLRLALPHRGVTKGPAKLAIRPEAVIITAEGGQDGLAGEIAKTAYLGSHMEYSIRTPEGTFFVVDADVAQPLAVGTPVTVSCRHTGVTLLPPA